jgi:threonine/homoserine/homoserine lactone efflux protein
MMPGPMLTVAISETSKRGFWVGPQMVFGHGLVELLLVACLAGGLAYSIQQPIVTGSIGVIGGLVLLWFGWGICSSIRKGEVSLSISEASAAKESSPQWLNNPFNLGILLSLTNPYWFLWWATVGVSYVVVALSLGATGLVTFFTGHILSDLIWFSFVSFIINAGRNFVSNRLYRGLLIICAACLVLLGCWFSYDGLQKLALLVLS